MNSKLHIVRGATPYDNRTGMWVRMIHRYLKYAALIILLLGPGQLAAASMVSSFTRLTYAMLSRH